MALDIRATKRQGEDERVLGTHYAPDIICSLDGHYLIQPSLPSKYYQASFQKENTEILSHHFKRN